ncbi:16S rRNA (cytosine(1407)-C(5))-methyltransferase RsmF [Vibrio casei]|uniref:Ribosomal RNA small subunit methyltransferase F n=1 Tax=Vibrio casei TaxID=673372 RepID=A0A368LN39_9VIBR|nr:16S rRNA (cytosine(1407)-C(5))-methyltransferase RsmF [Vibrio casei]RCS73221.1 16S rRNA (cytosine(1407)-C(5))-methyltransferase RsmF [Vibrio casei]SJN18738.1 Ribosomal RNA small subunit methyltransferase F [Vibrio casei]
MHPNVKLPEAFLQLVESTMPSHLSMDEFIEACQRPLRRSIRVNTLKITVEEFCSLAINKQWHLSAIPWCKEGFWINREDESVPLGNTAEHLSGLFYIQEASSMLPVTALLKNNEFMNVVLDMAAAPGSKTTQIAAAMNNHGALVANEYAASRVKVLSANIQRCGVHNTALTNFDARVFGNWLPEQFDTILLDAPCSGEGTVRKDPDAMSNWDLESINDISATQKDLIESAFHALKPGGTLVYSTCTLNLQENQNVCLHVKETFGDAVEFIPLGDLFENAEKAITEHGFLHIYPQVFDSEGFFVAKLKKNTSVPPPEVKKRLGKFPFEKANDKLIDQITNELYQTLALNLPNDSQVWIRDKEVWLFPTAMVSMIGELRFSRIGIKLAETLKVSKKAGPMFRWQHEAVMALAKGDNPLLVDLPIDDAREWFMGRDVRLDITPGKGEVIVGFSGAVIGLGKWVGNRIKNGLPRELVRDKNLF